MSSIEHYIIVPTEFIKLYSILTLFRVFLIQMKPVCDAFLDLFSNLFSLVFFLNCGYLFCLTCKNNKKNYERAESEETKKNKKNIQKQKRICKVSFTCDVRKKSKVRTSTPLFLSMHKHSNLI